MPTKAKTPCRAPGCGRACHGGYCDAHKSMASNWSRHQAKHGNDRQRGYGWAWKKLRKRVLARDNHMCQSCLSRGIITPATEVDHIRPKAHGGTNDPDNLASICTPCHRKKTATERNYAHA